MNKYILIPILMFCLLGGFFLTSQMDPEQAIANYDPIWIVEAHQTASADDYQLHSLGWQVSGTLTSASYRLQAPNNINLRGSGCCCSYLPCLYK